MSKIIKEDRYTEDVVEFLETLPKQWHFKVWGGGFFQRVGIPDIIGVVNGKFIALELKATDGAASPLQLRNIDLINKAGGYAVVSFPEDFEQLKKDLKKL